MLNKKYFFIALLLVSSLAFSACTQDPASQSESIKLDVQDFTLEVEEEAADYEQAIQQVEQQTDTQINNQQVKGITMTASQKTQMAKPKMTIDQSKQYTAVLKTTAGDITIKLNAAETPNTVNNFVYLAQNNFYGDTIFHRVIDGFMIQGGDPLGNGTGGPGYRFDDEPFKGEYTRGTVAMANAGPNTNGSQFFIMHKDYPLPPNYVIFGQVTEGMEVVDKIATAATQPGGEGSTPVNPVTVTAVEVIEK